MKPILAFLCSVFFFTSAFAAEHTVRVDAAFAKPSLAGVTTGVAFLTLTSHTDDALIGVSSDVAAVSEIHDHLMEGGVMRMRKVEMVDLPAGEPIAMKSGGLHLMLFDMKRVLKEGDSLPLTLRFKKAPPLMIEVPVQAAPPVAASAEEHHHH